MTPDGRTPDQHMADVSASRDELAVVSRMKQANAQVPQPVKPAGLDDAAQPPQEDVAPLDVCNCMQQATRSGGVV